MSESIVPTAEKIKPYRYLAAYCRWLGTEPIASPIPPDSESTGDVIEADDEIDMTKPVELIVLVVKARTVRCRQLSGHRVITLRAADVFDVVPGLIISVDPNKYWQFKGHPYLSGRIMSTRIDAKALGLPPLEIKELGMWGPCGADNDDNDCDDGEELANNSYEVLAPGSRPLFAMQQILPGHNSDDFVDVDFDPIIKANDLREHRNFTEAQQIHSGLLEADLRCLDAHAHLGSMAFDSFPSKACDHYGVGVQIGELALGVDFEGVLSWDQLDNRPFLRCLHGFGLCLWKLDRWEEAAKVLERILELNPMDELDIKSMLPDVLAHRPHCEHAE